MNMIMEKSSLSLSLSLSDIASLVGFKFDEEV